MNDILQGPAIRRVAALENLNDAECMAGYLAGFDGKPCPENSSFSYVHGWKNGQADKHGNPNEAQRELARDYVTAQRKK